MNEERTLGNLLEKVEKKEKKSKVYVTLLSFSPVIFALALLYFTVKKVDSAEKELVTFNQKIKESKKTIDSLEDVNKTVFKRYNKLTKLFNFYDWSPESLKNVDSSRLEEAKKANNEILRILDGNKELNYEVIIRYYAKQIDSSGVKTGLRRTGYRDILFDNESWRSEIPSNKICFDDQVEISDVQLIALTLLREGVEIKKVCLYPKNILTSRKKANSIEISGDESLIDESPLNFKDIKSLKQLLKHE